MAFFWGCNFSGGGGGGVGTSCPPSGSVHAMKMFLKEFIKHLNLITLSVLPFSLSKYFNLRSL